MVQRQEHILAVRLKHCGRFLFYQVGGKAGQQRILITLLTRGSMTQKELQDLLEISSGALSEILQKMEDAGWIARTKSADDKRQVDLSLSKSGTEIAMQVKEHYAYTLDRAFSCLSADEKTLLEELLGKLSSHLDTLKTDPEFSQNLEDSCCKPQH